MLGSENAVGGRDGRDGRDGDDGVGGGMVDLSGGIDPASKGIDAGVSADGTKDRVAGHGGTASFFEKDVENGMKIFAASERESGGVGMAIHGAILAELVVARDIPGAAPVNEFFFDGSAVGMAADDAFTAMVVEVLLRQRLTDFVSHFQFILFSVFCVSPQRNGARTRVAKRLEARRSGRLETFSRRSRKSRLADATSMCVW
ncbi:MAG TPA: hypothetical protein VK795_06175 [Terriglobales bacterium]|nr:hypothetical protein [Terriglobales bacterium]